MTLPSLRPAAAACVQHGARLVWLLCAFRHGHVCGWHGLRRSMNCSVAEADAALYRTALRCTALQDAQHTVLGITCWHPPGHHQLPVARPPCRTRLHQAKGGHCAELKRLFLSRPAVLSLPPSGVPLTRGPHALCPDRASPSPYYLVRRCGKAKLSLAPVHLQRIESEATTPPCPLLI